MWMGDVSEQTEGCMTQKRETGNIQGCVGNYKRFGVPGTLILGTRHGKR